MHRAAVPGLALVALALLGLALLAGCDSTNPPTASTDPGSSAPEALRNVPTHPRSNVSMAALLTGRLELRGACLVVAAGGLDTLPVWPDGAWLDGTALRYGTDEVARIGAQVRLGGGYVPVAGVNGYVNPIDPACVQPEVFWVGG